MFWETGLLPMSDAHLDFFLTLKGIKCLAQKFVAKHKPQSGGSAGRLEPQVWTVPSPGRAVSSLPLDTNCLLS